MPDETINPFTAARRAIWQAIDGWPELIDQFALKMRFDAEDSGTDGNLTSLPDSGMEPSMSRLPAIMVMPTSFNLDWWTHQMQRVSCVYQITIWTPRWQLPLAEVLAYEVRSAIFCCAADGAAASYIKLATGYHPKASPIQWANALVGPNKEIRASRVQMSIGLRLQDDPFTA